MFIEEKLSISQRHNYLSLIEEGIFFRAYNQSAYILNQYYHQELKIISNMVKKLNNQQIVFCAFPKTQIKQRLPHSVKTEWGYELKGNFELSNYQDWFEHILSLDSTYIKNINKKNINNDVNFSKKQEKVCWLLFNAGSDPNLPNHQGKTPLAFACLDGKEAIRRIFYKT